MSDYNYDAFTSKDYDFNGVTRPKAGEKAPDFVVATLDGSAKSLLEFDGDFLILEIGSLTCPLFQSRRKTMQTLGHEDSRVSSVVLYVREAHPGAAIPQHADFEAKRACANRLTAEDGETRLVLVDNLAGAAHKAYGGMPNTVFIINRNGCVVFRAQWNNPKATHKALDALLNDKGFRSKSYFRPGALLVSIRTLRRAGSGSAGDFLRSFPRLVWNNLIKRNVRLFFNRPPLLSRDTVC